MRRIALQKIFDKQRDSDEETASLATSSSPHQKPGDPCFQDSQDPYDL